MLQKRNTMALITQRLGKSGAVSERTRKYIREQFWEDGSEENGRKRNGSGFREGKPEG